MVLVFFVLIFKISWTIIHLQTLSTGKLGVLNPNPKPKATCGYRKVVNYSPAYNPIIPLNLKIYLRSAEDDEPSFLRSVVWQCIQRSNIHWIKCSCVSAYLACSKLLHSSIAFDVCSASITSPSLFPPCFLSKPHDAKALSFDWMHALLQTVDWHLYVPTCFKSCFFCKPVHLIRWKH